MNVSKQLATMQQTLSQLTEEFQQLQVYIANLEAENEWLRQQAAPAVQNNSQSENDGLHTLQKLYDDGIHVCPAYFGKTHDGGCLLCMEVLSNVSN